ncbi:hypothetical protein JCM10296v2_003888 [Rhodotorula toruloides]
MSHYPHWANDFDQIARLSQTRQQALEDAPVHEAVPVPFQMALMAGDASPPVALTPDQLLHRRLPNLVWQYLRCWQTVVCRGKERPKPERLVMTRMASSDGTTGTRDRLKDTDLAALTLALVQNAPRTYYVSPILTNKIFLVDNGPGHRFNLANAGPLIWIAKDPANVGAPCHRTTGQQRGYLHKQYAEWAKGRYGAAPEYTQRWTIDSDSPHLTEAHRSALTGPFQRVMMGPFNGQGFEQDPSVLVEHGERWHPTSTFHLLKVWHVSAHFPVHFGFKVPGVHEPGQREAGESAHVLR